MIGRAWSALTRIWGALKRPEVWTIAAAVAAVAHWAVFHA